MKRRPRAKRPTTNPITASVTSALNSQALKLVSRLPFRPTQSPSPPLPSLPPFRPRGLSVPIKRTRNLRTRIDGDPVGHARGETRKTNRRHTLPQRRSDVGEKAAHYLYLIRKLNSFFFIQLQRFQSHVASNPFAAKSASRTSSSNCFPHTCITGPVKSSRNHREAAININP